MNADSVVYNSPRKHSNADSPPAPLLLSVFPSSCSFFSFSPFFLSFALSSSLPSIFISSTLVSPILHYLLLFSSTNRFSIVLISIPFQSLTMAAPAQKFKVADIVRGPFQLSPVYHCIPLTLSSPWLPLAAARLSSPRLKCPV